MRMNLKVFIVLIALSLQSWAQQAESLMARDLLANAKIMKSDVKIYNYFFLGESWSGFNTESGRKDYVARYVSARAGSFWDEGFTDDSRKNYAAGPALYFAIDPLISQTYGNTFIELTIPADTRFINVVSPIPIKKDTQAALVAEGIVSQADLSAVLTKSGFYRDTLRMMVLPQYRHFRKLVQSVFTKNNIQFVEYNFNASLSQLCRKHSYSAFAFVGTFNANDPKNAVLAPSFLNASLFSTELNIPPDTSQLLTPAEADQKSRILKFRSMLEQLDQLRGKKKAIADYISSQYSESELQTLKKSIFSCDN